MRESRWHTRWCWRSEPAALAASGYRAGRDRHHERVIDSLFYTVGVEQQLVGRLHRYRRLRNEMTYERVSRLEAHEVEVFVSHVERLRTAVVEWLNAMHPRLMSAG